MAGAGQVVLSALHVALHAQPRRPAIATCARSVALLAIIVRNSRTLCASCASAWSSATWASAGSSRTSVCPAFTKSVSSALIASTVPATCGVI